MTFESDKLIGEYWERQVIAKLQPDIYEKEDGDFPYWDYTIVKDGQIQRIEVKSDRMARKTGNVAIEWSCSKRPSGIQKTKAKYWVYVVIDTEPEFYKIPVAVLKDLIHRGEHSDIKTGGDDGMSIMFLFPRHVFSQYKI